MTTLCLGSPMLYEEMTDLCQLAGSYDYFPPRTCESFMIKSQYKIIPHRNHICIEKTLQQYSHFCVYSFWRVFGGILKAGLTPIHPYLTPISLYNLYITPMYPYITPMERYAVKPRAEPAICRLSTTRRRLGFEGVQTSI